MAERLIPVADVVAFLARAASSDAVQLVVGCALDDDTGDKATLIVAVEPSTGAVTLEGGRRVLLRNVRLGDVIDTRPGAPLLAAIEAARSPAETAAREERVALGLFGIDADKLRSPEDVGRVLSFMRTVADGELPDREQRFAFFKALRASCNRRHALIGAETLAAVVYGRRGETPDDVHWQRAWFLRAAGRLTDAIAVSEVLYVGSVRGAADRKILATTRAAALLDLYEATRSWPLLGDAERAAKIAYGISKDEEVTLVYRRLEALRTSHSGKH